MDTKPVTFAFRLTHPESERVRELATLREQRPSDVLRDAVAEFLRREMPASQ